MRNDDSHRQNHQPNVRARQDRVDDRDANRREVGVKSIRSCSPRLAIHTNSLIFTCENQPNMIDRLILISTKKDDDAGCD